MSTSCLAIARFMTATTIAAGLVIGCTAMPRDTAGPNAATNHTIVRVDNRTIDQMVIYFVREGVPVRLATVPGFSKQVIRLHRALTGSGIGVQLAARMLGSNVYYTTEAVSIVPGDILDWTIGGSAAATYLVRAN